MTRLIDADGIINVMKQQAGCATCDNYNGIRCRACQWDDAITSIYDYADYHTVEAIPIEWINAKIERLKKYENNEFAVITANLFKSLLIGWEAEQEEKE